ncbi:SurA N-terminal domain-containing protein [Bergeriella denitrificans]|uniref:Periplasmic chaperone PpiD n=1 Tax=Bergeriella denitrificans TaxID=494 RepID=A0A378UF80_BERDE|nr:SurA N-terminal domain-containing protein [Bergeriella denitrificans]STZ75840.1 peptidyl-prolyl cis-trans isomerase [Bergeriella denitrificans]
MFHTVEKYKGPAQIMLGLIALTFVGFGVSTAAAPGSDYIVQIGDEKVSEQSLNAATQNMQGENRDAVFQSLVQRAYLTQGAKLMGIAVSQEQIKQIIVDDPNFHDSTGKFSQELLSQYLSQRHMSEDQFVEEIRSQFALQNLLNLVQNGTLISDEQAAQLINLTQAVRTIRSVTFDLESFAGKVKTDDAALQRYYEANKKDYVVPQAAKIEYVALTLQDLAQKQSVSEEEVRKAFDEQAAQAGPRREIAHIFFPAPQDEAARAAVKAEAEKVLAKVKAKPAGFAAEARRYAQNAGAESVLWVSKNGALGAELENAVFSLPKGQISGLIAAETGFYIVQVLNIQDKPVFEQEKAHIEAELKQRKAMAEFNAAKEKLAESAFNHPDSLAETAKALGLKIEAPDEWLTRENGKAAGMPDNLIEAVFSDEVLKKKHNSEPVSVSDNAVWVVRAKEVREEQTAPFAEVKDSVLMAYLRSEASRLAGDKADEVLADLKSGRQVEVKWSGVSELNAQQARQSMPPEAYAELIKARPADGKPAYVLLKGLPAPVILEVQKISAPENVTEQIPAAKQAMLQQQAGNTFDYLMQYLYRQIPQETGAQKVNPGE